MGAMLILAGATGGTAKDFEARARLAELSIEVGLEQKDMELLVKAQAPGAEGVAAMLRKRFEDLAGPISTGGAIQDNSRDGTIRWVGSGWRLKVWGGGSRFAYFNQMYTRQQGSILVPVEKRFSNGELEAIGRAFIDEHLSDLMPLAPGEALVPLATIFEMSSGVSADGVKEEDQIVSAVVHFGRTVDGFHVVGPGSSAAIHVANDGEVYGFDVDWPAYERTGKIQGTVPVDEIKKRLLLYGPGESAADEVAIRRLECGYFDGGQSRHGSGTTIQAGCVALSVASFRDPKSGRMGTVNLITEVPAGVEVVWDDEWPVVQALIKDSGK